MSWSENFSLRSLNTFGLDCKARYYAVFTNTEELKIFLQDEKVKKGPLLILGGGSNLLLTKDFDGVVLHNQIKGIEVLSETAEEVIVKSNAGEVWHEFVLYAVEKGWGGIENLSLIPGYVGASPVQNIGAYGVEIKDVLEEVEAVEISGGTTKTFSNEECAFGYRESIFKKTLKGKYIITAVTFRLKKNPVLNTSYGAISTTLNEMGVEHPGIKEVSEAVIKIRSSKLPDPKVIGNAGSFFKNPEISESDFLTLQKEYPAVPKFPGLKGGIKVPAGWLIEQCGWKGKRVGETGVHKDQALVLVNYGNAHGNEIWVLAQEVLKSVKEKFGIDLEPEVNVI